MRQRKRHIAHKHTHTHSPSIHLSIQTITSCLENWVIILTMIRTMITRFGMIISCDLYISHIFFLFSLVVFEFLSRRTESQLNMGVFYGIQAPIATSLISRISIHFQNELAAKCVMQNLSSFVLLVLFFFFSLFWSLLKMTDIDCKYVCDFSILVNGIRSSNLDIAFLALHFLPPRQISGQFKIYTQYSNMIWCFFLLNF